MRAMSAHRSGYSLSALIASIALASTVTVGGAVSLAEKDSGLNELNEENALTLQEELWDDDDDDEEEDEDVLTAGYGGEPEPDIVTFDAFVITGSLWGFEGQIDGVDDLGGHEINFGGVLAGKTTTTDSIGYFLYTESGPSSGTVTAQFSVEYEGETYESNIAEDEVIN